MEHLRPDPSVTALLAAWRDGDGDALSRLIPLLYEPMRQLARRQMAGEKPGQTLTATALVHEAFLRLVAVDVPWQDRRHFLALAARVMRRILVDRSRAKLRQKRGAGGAMVSLDEIEIAAPAPDRELPALDEALERLAGFDPRKAQIVDLLFFGGLTYEEAADALAISRATLHRDLRLAKAWLHQQVDATLGRRGRREA
jgi:RNA polymerase sigma factor (TIGR02999 family)